MATGNSIKKIGVALLVLVITAIASGQTKIVDVPIVSDKPVVKTDSLRIVDKDEYQRIVNKQTERVQKLENKIKELENRIVKLESQIEGG